MRNRIYILSDSLHSGKTTLLHKWIETKDDVSGFLSPVIEGKRHFFNIKTGESKLLEVESSNLKIGKYFFDEKVFQWAIDEIEIALKDKRNYLILDEIGPLEIKFEQGFHSLIKKLQNSDHLDKKIIFINRDFLVQDFIAKYSFENVILLPLNYFKKEKIEPLNGIVLAGGKSSRMQSDKALIKYQQNEQWKVAKVLLEPFSEKVFISINDDQFNSWANIEEENFIVDAEQFQNKGPISGILSVARENNDRGFLVLGVDYPLLKFENLIYLNNQRSEQFEAVCFEKEGFLEPLCTIYEEAAIEKMKIYFENAGESLTGFLKTLKAKIIKIDDAEFLKNVNSQEEFQAVLKSFN